MSRSLGRLLRGAATAAAIAGIPIMQSCPASAGFVFSLNVEPGSDEPKFSGSGFIDLPQTTTCNPLTNPSCIVDFSFAAKFGDVERTFTEDNLVYTADTPDLSPFILTWTVDPSGPFLKALNLYTEPLIPDSSGFPTELPATALTLQIEANLVSDVCFHNPLQGATGPVSAKGCLFQFDPELEQPVQFLSEGTLATATIPLPGTLPLLASGLSVMLLLARRRNRVGA